MSVPICQTTSYHILEGNNFQSVGLSVVNLFLTCVMFWQFISGFTVIKVQICDAVSYIWRMSWF
jgi:hypothetical protein